MKYILMLMTAMLMLACQNTEAPQQQAAMPAQDATRATPVQQSSMPADDSAVAVRKPEPGHSARQMQQLAGTSEAKPTPEELKQDLQQTAAKQAEPAATKLQAADSSKPVNTKPSAAAKASSAEMATKSPDKAATKTAQSEVAKATLPSGDASRGKSLARKCQACHNLDARNKVGPGLAGIFGRKAGAMAGVRYSEALASGAWSWDAEHLSVWLCDSKSAVKQFSGNAGASTKMPAQRICNPADQADLIAYLKTL